VVKESGDSEKPDVLGFIYPQENAPYDRGPYPHERYLASIDSIETLTGLDLFSILGEDRQRIIESGQPATLWPVEGRYFSEGCKRSRSFAER